MSTLHSFGVWNWFIAGGILLAIEVIAPGTFMLWLGLSAIAVGAISLAIDWSWQAQFVCFAVFALASIPVWLRVGRAVETIMTRDPVTVRPDQLVSEALEMLNTSKKTQLIVVDERRPVGIVHFHDLLRAGVA